MRIFALAQNRLLLTTFIISVSIFIKNWALHTTFDKICLIWYVTYFLLKIVRCALLWTFSVNFIKAVHSTRLLTFCINFCSNPHATYDFLNSYQFYLNHMLHSNLSWNFLHNSQIFCKHSSIFNLNSSTQLS